MAAQDARPSRTAGEAGWRLSRYNVQAKLPESGNVAIANLLSGTCAEYAPLELYLLSVLEDLDERHPVIERLARRGIIANFDERAALEAFARVTGSAATGVNLVICPTMGCNFDCPYCFEEHGGAAMTPAVQDDVAALAGRMLDASGQTELSVVWYGGEPLLAPDVIESLSPRLAALAQERGGTYRASIITNGYLLSQDAVDLLAAAKVDMAQVTLDGLGATHDATRHLAGGGATFERITANLREGEIPFRVTVRQNVHEGNRAEMDDLAALVAELAAQSGNELAYSPAVVTGSAADAERGGQVGLLCEGDANEVAMRQEVDHLSAARARYCCAQDLWSIGIDASGNLQKCWEAVGSPETSFGTARDWDPTDPLRTAGAPDNLTRYLNTAAPVHDEECRACTWLPLCAGGCPHRRLSGGRRCVPFKDDPERYVLALHARAARTARTARNGKVAQDGDGERPARV